jgi:hypothetical protein
MYSTIHIQCTDRTSRIDIERPARALLLIVYQLMMNTAVLVMSHNRP